MSPAKSNKKAEAKNKAEEVKANDGKAVETEEVPNEKSLDKETAAADEDASADKVPENVENADVAAEAAETGKANANAGGKKRKSTGDEEQNSVQVPWKYRKIKNGPKVPLTGYICFMLERREQIRKGQPTKNSIEQTRIIGEEWSNMAEEQKNYYRKLAEKDRERYDREMRDFQKANPQVIAEAIARDQEKNKNKTRKSLDDAKNNKMHNGKAKSISPVIQTRQKQKRSPTPTNRNANNNKNSNSNSSNASSSNAAAAATTMATSNSNEIQIFTNEFLENNKNVDSETRNLRKNKTDLEQHTSALEKHVDGLRHDVQKITIENNMMEHRNRQLETYLNKLKLKLVNALSSLPLPSQPNGATVDNIESYMLDLYELTKLHNHGPACVNKAKDIIRKLDLEISLS